MNTRVTRFSFEVWSSDPRKSRIKRENFAQKNSNFVSLSDRAVVSIIRSILIALALHSA